MNVLLEAFCIALTTLLVGLALHVALGHHSLHANSPTMKEELIRLSVILFLTGFSIHVLYEFTGLNKWYCKNKE